MKESFLLHTKQHEAIKLLSLEQKGKLLDAIFAFAEDNDTDFSDDPMLMMAFAFIKSTMTEDRKKWEDVCKKRSEAGKKGNAVRWGSQKVAKIANANENRKCDNLSQKSQKVANVADMIYKDSKESMNISIKKNELSKDNSQKELTNNSILSTIKERWNELVKTNNSLMPAIQAFSDSRKTMALARVREYGITKVLEAIDKAIDSDFLNGKNDRGWKASFDWLMKPNNFVKVLEGNYVNENATLKTNNYDNNNRKQNADNRRGYNPTNNDIERFNASF